VTAQKEIERCVFCEGRCEQRYRMEEFEIWQCKNCGTGRAWPPPPPETLREFYDGFLKGLTAELLPRFISAGRLLYRDLGLRPEGGLRMLDVGGGGGFFAKVFEELGYGSSTYVDLDPESTAFARDTLGLRDAVNADAGTASTVVKGLFDFVYCRHVIEHLADPTTFMRGLLSVVNAGGLCVVQCPNGASLEYFAYPWSSLRNRLSRIRRANGYSRTRVLSLALSGCMLHGMDPPRHLWAITKRGMLAWARRSGVSCRTYMRHLGNLAYSPHYRPKDTFRGRLSDFLGQRVLSPIHGGTHLVAILRKEDA